MRSRYSQILKDSSKGVSVIGNFEEYEEIRRGGDILRIRKRNLKLVDCLLLPDLFKLEDAL